LVDRDYAKIVQKRFFPEPRGRLVDAFLNNFFHEYIDYDFTANLENDLDAVANGKVNWKNVLLKFWSSFKKTSDSVMEIKNTDIVHAVENLLMDYIFKNTSDEELKKIRQCTKCKDGELGLRTGKFGAFIGCSNYPECNYKRSLFNEELIDTSKENNKVIGIDSKTKKEILLKKGPYGLYLEKEEGGKLKRVSLPTNISPESVNLETATNLLSFPKILGKHPSIGENIFVKIGRYGPYLECNKKSFALKHIDKVGISLDEAVQFIDAYKPKSPRKKFAKK
jgi:DNA topoisomerase-1